MTNYRRIRIEGGTYFFTQVTHERQPWLCTDVARPLLRSAFLKVREKYPFAIDAIVLLPHRYVTQGIYSVDWGMKEKLMPLLEVWDR